MSAFKYICCRVKRKFFSEVILDLSNCKICLVDNLPLSDRHLNSILHVILVLFPDAEIPKYIPQHLIRLNSSSHNFAKVV